MMKNVLVIGGTGFIGSHLVEQLIKRGCRTQVLVRPSSDLSFLKSLQAGLRYGDLLDRESLVNALRGTDTIFCVVNVKPDGKAREEYKKELYSLHTQGTKNLLDASRANSSQRIIYFSSVASIGYEKGVSVYNDFSASNPVDAYGQAKLCAENILRENSNSAKLAITILRPPAVYGERGMGVLKKIIYFTEKKLVPIIGSGENKQSIVYVGNLVNLALAAAENPLSISKTYIVTDERAYSVNELVEVVAAKMNARPFKVHIPPDLIISSVWLLNFIGSMVLKRKLLNRESFIAISSERIFDGSRAIRELGYKQEYDLSSGIARVIQWYSKNRNV